MRKTAAVFVLAFACLFITGCPAQAPVTPPPTVAVTWTAGTPCTSCTYIVSRCTAAAAATSCASYTPLNQATPVATTAYTDSAPPTGVSVLYIIQEVQAGATGQPSNPSAPVPVPVYPGTPGTPSATATAALAPPVVGDKHEEVLASNHPSDMLVTAKLVR
jgi:hypothetical protein